ncbi:AraC family ligand binding domain-containing protein [Lonsdalea quercina]|uniref:AraC family ligand binding domain-containing protein n=1 Tax=Lonsdalea quercina TaxID=71657 RepID=UPI003975EFC9
MSPIRTLQQRYWFSPQFPFLECRSTWQSRQPYKVHSHAQLSVGCLERGSTQCRVGEQTCLLNAGDVVVIPPGLPHSCNPLPGKTRRYHRLYLNAQWCDHRLKRGDNDSESLISDIVTYSSGVLFQQIMQIITRLHASPLAGIESALLYSQNRQFSLSMTTPLSPQAKSRTL